MGSSIAQEADGGIYPHAGPEIGVASTAPRRSVVLALLSLYFGRCAIWASTRTRVIQQLQELGIIYPVDCNGEVKRIAMKYAECSNFPYLGRQFNFPRFGAL